MPLFRQDFLSQHSVTGFILLSHRPCNDTQTCALSNGLSRAITTFRHQTCRYPKRTSRYTWYGTFYPREVIRAYHSNTSMIGLCLCCPMTMCGKYNCWPTFVLYLDIQHGISSITLWEKMLATCIYMLLNLLNNEHLLYHIGYSIY